jgi:hypothetical protein
MKTKFSFQMSLDFQRPTLRYTEEEIILYSSVYLHEVTRETLTDFHEI